MTNFHFNYRFTDEDLRRDFERFINNNVPNLFSDSRAMTKNYTVSWIRARSIINPQGKDRQALMEIANEIQAPSSNNSPFASLHLANTLATVHGIANGNWDRLIEEFKKLLRMIKNENYRYNVVWYAGYRPIAERFGL